jgi:hypothetical protein
MVGKQPDRISKGHPFTYRFHVSFGNEKESCYRACRKHLGVLILREFESSRKKWLNFIHIDEILLNLVEHENRLTGLKRRKEIHLTQ